MGKKKAKSKLSTDAPSVIPETNEEHTAPQFSGLGEITTIYNCYD
jgi:hypothetical protein